MKRIKLSTNMWVDFYVMAALWLVLGLALIWIFFFLEDMLLPELLTRIGLMSLFGLSMYWGFREYRKFLLTMEIEETAIRSYLFDTVKCEVSLERDVYYALVNVYNVGKCIAISNEWFEWRKRKSGWMKDFVTMDQVDISSMILLPYHERVAYSLPVEDWKRADEIVVEK